MDHREIHQVEERRYIPFLLSSIFPPFYYTFILGLLLDPVTVDVELMTGPIKYHSTSDHQTSPLGISSTRRCGFPS
jgi:hypothetical protein